MLVRGARFEVGMGYIPWKRYPKCPQSLAKGFLSVCKKRSVFL